MTGVRTSSRFLVTYSYETGIGKRITFLSDTSGTFTVPRTPCQILNRPRRGCYIRGREKTAHSYGHIVSAGRGTLYRSCAAVSQRHHAPPWTWLKTMPLAVVTIPLSRSSRQSTVGSISGSNYCPRYRVAVILRLRVFGDIMSNILCSREELAYAMPDGEKLVEVDNVMSLAYSRSQEPGHPFTLERGSGQLKGLFPSPDVRGGRSRCVRSGRGDIGLTYLT